MKATTVLGILVLGGAVVAGGVFVWKKADPSASAVASIRNVVPDDVLFYAECENLAGTLAQMKTQESWADLEASPLLQDDDMGLRPFLDALTELSAKVEYDLNEANLMKFLGSEVGLAARPNPAGAGLQLALVARLDVPALSKDLLTGEINSKALQVELQNRASRAEFSQAAVEQLGEYQLTSLARGDESYHVVLMENVLVVADDVGFARNTVTTRTGTTAALSASAAFQADLAKLPEGTKLFDWTNLEVVRTQRQALETLWHGWIVPRLPGGGLPSFPFDALIDATSQCPSIARAWTIPGGDLYSVSWEYSKTATELFDDDVQGDVGVVAMDGHHTYVEMRDLHDLGPAWDASEARKRLAGSRLGEWLESFGDDPAAALRKAAGALPGPMGRGPLQALEDVPVEGSFAFPVRLGTHVLKQQSARLFEGSSSLGVELIAFDSDPPVYLEASLKLGLEGRALVLTLFEAIAEDESTPGSWGEPLAGRAVLAVAPDRGGPTLHATLVGDLLVLATDRARLAKIVERIDAGGASTARPLALLNETSAERHVGLFIANESLMEKFAQDPDSFPTEVLDFMAGPADQTMTVRVGEALGDVTIDQVSTFGSGAMSARWGKIVGEGGWESSAMAQDGSILYGVSHLNVAEVYEMVRSIESLEMARVELDVDEFLGLSFRNEFLPSFGSEWTLSVVRNHDRVEGGPPPIPDVTLQVKVADDGPVKRVLGRITDQIAEEAERGGGRGPSLARSTLDTGAMVVLGLGRGGPPIEPAYGLIDDFLTITTSERSFRALSVSARGAAPGPLFASPVAKGALPHFATPFSQAGFLDWGALVDQVQTYAPEMSQATADVDYSDMPESPSEQEWEEYMNRKNREREEKAATAVQDVKDWLDVLRVPRAFYWSAQKSDGRARSRIVIQF